MRGAVRRALPTLGAHALPQPSHRFGHASLFCTDCRGMDHQPQTRAQCLCAGRCHQLAEPGHPEPDQRRLHQAADAGHLHRRGQPCGSDRGRCLLAQPAGLAAGPAVLRPLLLLAAPHGPRSGRALGRPCRAPPKPGLQPLHRAAPDQLRRAAGLDLLSAHGPGRRAAAGVCRGRADRPALPVLGAYRAGQEAGLVRPLVLRAQQSPRAPCRQRALSGPELRRHSHRLGPALRHLQDRGRRGALRLRHARPAQELGPALGQLQRLPPAGA